MSSSDARTPSSERCLAQLEALPSIDDDNDVRRVSEAVTALRSEAAKADRALELDDGAEEPDDEPASH